MDVGAHAPRCNFRDLPISSRTRGYICTLVKRVEGHGEYERGSKD